MEPSPPRGSIRINQCIEKLTVASHRESGLILNLSQSRLLRMLPYRPGPFHRVLPAAGRNNVLGKQSKDCAKTISAKAQTRRPKGSERSQRVLEQSCFAFLASEPSRWGRTTVPKFDRYRHRSAVGMKWDAPLHFKFV